MKFKTGTVNFWFVVFENSICIRIGFETWSFERSFGFWKKNRRKNASSRSDCESVRPKFQIYPLWFRWSTFIMYGFDGEFKLILQLMPVQIRLFRILFFDDQIVPDLQQFGLDGIQLNNLAGHHYILHHLIINYEYRGPCWFHQFIYSTEPIPVLLQACRVQGSSNALRRKSIVRSCTIALKILRKPTRSFFRSLMITDCLCCSYYSLIRLSSVNL